jgi:thiamine-phosphate pyrophosphorylase
LRYAITNLSASSPSCGLDAAEARRMRLLADLRRWVTDGIDFVQLREKRLEAGELFSLAEHSMALLRESSPATSRPRLLVNSRADLAAAAHADGVHLTTRPGELTPAQVRSVFEAAGHAKCFVSQSCHSLDEVARARDLGADLILFGPVFGKTLDGELITPAAGLDQLQTACNAAGIVPVLALGGVTPANAGACLDVGAAGIAGIRLFA